LSLTDEDIERRGTLAQEQANLAYELKPDSQAWGLYSYDDGHPARGGGVAAFLWFRSEPELLDFIALHLLVFTSKTVPVEPELTAVDETVDKLRNGELEQEPGRVALNNSLQGFCQIVWWGTRSNLFSADSEFPRSVRARFREDGGEQEFLGHPITEEEEKEFLDYLEMYGL
jgi:hypothetical protein